MDWRGAALAGLALAALGVAGCGALGLSPEAPQTSMELPDDVETAVKEALSASADVSGEEIEIVAVQEKEWPDACLGLGGEDELCAQVITPGWKVKLRADDEAYVFRTNEDGSVLRLEQ